MKRIEQIVNSLDVHRIFNEELYKLTDLEEVLKSFNDDKINASEFILTPYYIEGSKIYELYAYEFHARFVEPSDFGKHLITESDPRQNICYVEIPKDEQIITKKRFFNYIGYLLSSQDIKREVESRFSNFNSDNLYFEIY